VRDTGLSGYDQGILQQHWANFSLGNKNVKVNVKNGFVLYTVLSFEI
jgi:hypothetical protein